MDKLSFILQAIQVIPRFIPGPKPPALDYKALIEAVPKSEIYPTLAHDKTIYNNKRPVALSSIYSTEEGPQQTGCISCSRSHLSTVSGALSESLRFAREGGIQHPEVQRRIMLSEDEINIMERIDLAPDALAKSPADEAKLAQEYLPHIRSLRQDIGAIKSLEELESLAARASLLSQEFRLRQLQLKGVDLNPVIALAKEVQAGRISMDDAKRKLRELLPDEES